MQTTKTNAAVTASGQLDVFVTAPVMAHCSLLAPHAWHARAASDICAPHAWQALVSSCGLTPLSSDVASTHSRNCAQHQKINLNKVNIM